MKIKEDKVKYFAEKSRYVVTINALAKAEEKFHEVLSKEGYDPAYWNTEFTAYLPDNDLKTRIKRATLEGEELK